MTFSQWPGLESHPVYYFLSCVLASRDILTDRLPRIARPRHSVCGRGVVRASMRQMTVLRHVQGISRCGGTELLVQD